jgi:hypothetical protein
MGLSQSKIKQIVKFAEGYRAPAGLDAKTALDALTQIESTTGLTPENVVDASRAKDAPLHNCFEWDNEAAAEKYRLKQAGTLIRAVKVIIEDAEPIEYRPFVRVIEQDEPQYKNVSFLSVDQEKQVEENLKRFLLSAQRSLDEFIKITKDKKRKQSLLKAQKNLQLAIDAV